MAISIPPTPQSPMPRMPSESGATMRVDVLWAHPEVAKRHLHGLDGVHGQVHPAGAAELVAEALDGLPDCGRVDDRQHLLDVLG
jgi:hypothetical protein